MGIEQGISPEETISVDAIGDPAGHAVPPADGDDVVRPIRTLEVAPADILSVAPDEETICLADAGKQPVPLPRRLFHELQPVPPDPA
jgi:hypothetical protein